MICVQKGDDHHLSNRLFVTIESDLAYGTMIVCVMDLLPPAACCTHSVDPGTLTYPANE